MKVICHWVGGTVRMGLGLALVVMAMAPVAQAGGAPGPISVPEIDPGSMGSALSLLIGGAFLLAGRSRNR